MAPSSLAMLANIKDFLPEKLTTTPPTFYSNRPTQDYASFPAALLHPVFGQFQHDREHYEPKRKDNMFLQELSMQMVRFYDHERERARVFREILENNYGIQLMAAEVDNSSSCTDGHMQERGNVCVISEAKNELGLGGKDPYFQGGFYYVELIRRHAYERINSVLPCILIFYAGPNFGFAALAMTDAKIHLAPLTPLIPLYAEPHDYFMHKMAAQAFGAFRRAVKQLKKYYNEGNAQIQNPLPASPESLEFPYIREFMPIQGGEGATPIQFKYTGQHPSKKLIFYGETEKGGQICIKFTRRYSSETHQYCASLRAAPVLHACQMIIGGWYLVVMDAINPNEHRIYSERHMDNFPSTVGLGRKIREVVTQLHNQNMVHGDLRDTNIVVANDGSFMLIDFDWSGIEGQVRYPPLVNRVDIQRPNNVLDGNLIMRQDDVYMLDRLFPLPAVDAMEMMEMPD